MPIRSHSVVNDQGQISAEEEEVFKSKPPTKSNSSNFADDSIGCRKNRGEKERGGQPRMNIVFTTHSGPLHPERKGGSEQTHSKF